MNRCRDYSNVLKHPLLFVGLCFSQARALTPLIETRDESRIDDQSIERMSHA